MPVSDRRTDCPIMNFLSVFIFLSVSVSVSLCFEDKTIYQYLNESGYSLLSSLIQQAKLDTELNGKGPYTLLAPSNAALATLDPDVTVALGQNTLLLKSLLKYHILDGFQLIPEFRDGRNEMTLNGQTIKVSNFNNQITLNNVSRITSNNDVILNNGVVHPIDNVLIPPIFSTNNLVAQMIIRDDIFNEITFGFLLSNLNALLEKGEYTIFAPTDYAFTHDANSHFYQGMPNGVHYYNEMLRYHIVPGARSSVQLKNGQVLYTLHGTPIHVTVTDKGVFVDEIRVSEADIGASNGVIHAIDGMLFPEDLAKELQTELTSGSSQSG